MSFTARPIKKPSIMGSKNPMWKGGEIKTKDGRIMCYAPDHPFPSKGRYVYRYRLLMESLVGRFLLPSEIVHHKNHDPGDDRPDNLEIMSADRHNRLHATQLRNSGRWARKHDRCVRCGSTDRRHKGNGLCTKCHDMKRRLERKARNAI